MLTAVEMRRKGGTAFATAEAVMNRARGEDRPMNEEEEKSFNAAMKDQEIWVKEAERLENFESAGAPPAGAPRIELEGARALTSLLDDLRLGGNLRAFKGENARERAYASGKWFMAIMARAHDAPDLRAEEWLRDHGIGIHAAQTSGTNTSGGYLIPTPMQNGIEEIRDIRGVVRRLVTPTPMSAETERINETGDEVTAYFVGEGEAPTTSTMSIKQALLTAKTLGSDIVINNNLSEDAVVGIAELVARSAGWAFADKEDRCAFLGDGTGDYGNILGVIAVANDGAHANALYTAIDGNTAFSTIDDADLLAMNGRIHGAARPGARWFISPEGCSQSIDRLLVAAGGNTSSNNSEGLPLRYLGRPVEYVDVMNSTLTAQISTAGLICYGDLNLALKFGERRGMAMFVNPFILGRQFQTVLTFSERFDIVVNGLGNNASDATKKKSRMIVMKMPGS